MSQWVKPGHIVLCVSGSMTTLPEPRHPTGDLSMEKVIDLLVEYFKRVYEDRPWFDVESMSDVNAIPAGDLTPLGAMPSAATAMTTHGTGMCMDSSFNGIDRLGECGTYPYELPAQPHSPKATAYSMPTEQGSTIHHEDSTAWCRIEKRPRTLSEPTPCVSYPILHAPNVSKEAEDIRLFSDAKSPRLLSTTTPDRDFQGRFRESSEQVLHIYVIWHHWFDTENDSVILSSKMKFWPHVCPKVSVLPNSTNGIASGAQFTNMD